MCLNCADSKDPRLCKDLVDGGFVYLDVRTNDEVSQGAPVDCVNVPAFARTDDGMMPMQSTFMKLVSESFPDKDVKMVVGCASGRVSLRHKIPNASILRLIRLELVFTLP